jgi:hypothetical protein
MSLTQQSGFFNPATVANNLNDAMDSPSTVPSSPELESDSGRASVVSLQSPISPPHQNVADSFVFAFDIDGVLVRGGRAIPEAIEAMKVLNGENEYGIQV